MAPIDPDAETEPAEFVIRYHNLGFALVTVTRLSGSVGHFDARCAGCLDAYDPYHGVPLLSRVRTWANKHAGECRALAQPEPEPGT